MNYIELCVYHIPATQRIEPTIEANDMWDIMEKALEHFLLSNPVANKVDKKCKTAQVSGVASLKKVVPKTGFELRVCEFKDFSTLTNAQNEEL